MGWVEAGDPAVLERRVRSGFLATFGRAPETVGRAPGRVNLIGEHTDYNRGLVLPTPLPHATYAALGRRDGGTLRVCSAQEPAGVWESAITDLGPGSAAGWAAYVGGVVWAMGEAGVTVEGLDVFVDSTVPVGAGLSSSAAIEGAVALGMNTLGEADLSREELVAVCIRAETEGVGAPTGGMDQTVSLLGSRGDALLIDFADPGRPVNRAVKLRIPGHSVLVTDTRVSHALVDGGYAQRRRECEAAADSLGIVALRDADPGAVGSLSDDVVRRRATHVVTEIQRVRDTVEALQAGRFESLGPLFAASHASLRDDFDVSCLELDAAVEAAVGAGAIAARMTGGGFGGSIVALVPDTLLDLVTAEIDAAFRKNAWAPPRHLLG